MNLNRNIPFNLHIKYSNSISKVSLETMYDSINIYFIQK